LSSERGRSAEGVLSPQGTAAVSNDNDDDDDDENDYLVATDAATVVLLKSLQQQHVKLLPGTWTASTLLC